MKLVVLALAAGTAYAECPNACSGHGSCGAFDECVCFPNWQEADCSGRTCPFAAAHVDTPKGDLDGSADALSGPSQNVVSGSMVYPHGTTEQYPYMADSAGTQLTNTGHAYAECGNKGICDRGSGECECFPGYAGAGCQKATCADPTCSGHGICMNAQNLAAQDHDNVYNLWDAEVGFSCLCEPGYSGPTCASKMCKYGIDPLYYDDDVMAVRAPTARVSFSVGNLMGTKAVGDAAAFGAARKSFLEGTYAIKFYDAFGEDYETAPLSVGAKCPEVVAALEGMANDVVPKHGVSCEMRGYTKSDKPVNGKGPGLQTVAYDLVFEENPGDLKPIEVNAYLDGERPTVYLADGNSTDQEFNVDIDVFPNWKGISGEFVDYFPSICHGVQIQVAKTPKEERTLGAAFTDSNNGLSADEENLLKACLGDADGNADNNVEVYNWDYGTPTPRPRPTSSSSRPPTTRRAACTTPAPSTSSGTATRTATSPSARTSSTSRACRRRTPARSSPSSRRAASPRSSRRASPILRYPTWNIRRAGSTRPTRRPSRPVLPEARRRSTRRTTRPAPRRASTTATRRSTSTPASRRATRSSCSTIGWMRTATPATATRTSGPRATS